MLKRLLCSLVVSCAGVTAFAGATFQYYVVPVNGITGISESALSKGKGPKYGGMINEKYADIFFDLDNRNKVISQFVESTKKSFPTAAIGPNQVVEDGASGAYGFQPFEQVQCRPKFSVNYKDAYVISIGVSRLSVFFNDYRSNVGEISQVIVPITYTVRFIKLDGAQVIFSKSETITSSLKDTPSSELYSNRSTQELKPNYLASLKSAVLEDALMMVNRQVEFASKNFKPKQSQVNVLYKDKEFIVFDKGSEVGFVSGEAFDADAEKYMSFQVRYTTEGLTVAQPAGGEMSAGNINSLREGSKLNFSFTKQGVDDAKPSVMAVHYTSEPLTPKQAVANSLVSILSDNIGFKTPFNLLKQDPDFDLLKLQIRSDINCNSDMWRKINGFADVSTVKRKDPDLFLKLDHFSTPHFTTVAETGVTSSNFFQSNVTLSLVDKSNVVHQNFSTTEVYENKRTDGKGLSLEQAQEVNLKNASLAATKQLVDGFRLTRKTVKVNSYSGGKVVLSEPIPASAFSQLSLVRPLTVAKKTILVPILKDDAKLEPTDQDGNTFAVSINQFGDKSSMFKTSDLVLVNGDINPARKIKFCELSRKRIFLPPNLKYGSGGELNFAQMLALTSKKYNFMQQSESFVTSMNNALVEGSFESNAVSQNLENAVCILPFEFVQAPKLDCPSGKCEGVIDVTLGFRVFDGDKKINEAGEARKIQFKDVRQSDVSEFVGYKVLELQPQILKGLAPKF